MNDWLWCQGLPSFSREYSKKGRNISIQISTICIIFFQVIFGLSRRIKIPFLSALLTRVSFVQNVSSHNYAKKNEKISLTSNISHFNSHGLKSIHTNSHKTKIQKMIAFNSRPVWMFILTLVHLPFTSKQFPTCKFKGISPFQNASQWLNQSEAD